MIKPANSYLKNETRENKFYRKLTFKPAPAFARSAFDVAEPEHEWNVCGVHDVTITSACEHDITSLSLFIYTIQD